MTEASHPPDGFVADIAQDSRGSALAVGLVCIVLFLLVNPFLAVFILAVVALFRRVPPLVFILAAALSFTLFFFFRDYGVEWYLGSTDDVPDYIEIYKSNYGASFADLVADFVAAPNGNELLWTTPWWALLNLFDASNDMFVFLHYLVIFLAVFAALATFSRRYLAPLVAVYLFLTPISVDSMAHIWRQQLAFSVFLAGVGLYTLRGRSFGQWLIYLTPFIHLSSVFFVMAFLTYRVIRSRGGFDNKLKFSIALLVLLAVIPALSALFVAYLDSIGLARIMSYFEGSGADVMRVYMLVGLYVVPILLAFYLLPGDDTNHLLIMLGLSVFMIVVGLPASNGIYDRLLMYALPFLGVFFFRCFCMNFPERWRLPALLGVFVTGAVRLYNPTLEDSGPMTFLAYGHALDPFMGALKMLVTL